MEAKTETLRNRVQELHGQMKQLAELAPNIGELERKKELEENNYKYFANTLEKARVDEALDPSKIPNISAVQRPSPPARGHGQARQDSLGVVPPEVWRLGSRWLFCVSWSSIRL